MQREVLAEFEVGESVLRYLREGLRVGMMMVPSACRGMEAPKRESLRGNPEIDVFSGWMPRASHLDPLVQVKLAGDEYPGAFAQGRTMLGSASNGRFAFAGQQVSRYGVRTMVTTRLTTAEGLEVVHEASWFDGESWVTIQTRLRNSLRAKMMVEMLTSFSLGCITPFDAGDAPGRLRVHRFRSGWSAEGRLETHTLEQLHLERSWSGAALFSERFGQVGTMPVRGWFPFVAVEDAEASVLWGAQLAWAGSWQMEISRQHDEVAISGGLADREFGHWARTLLPGEELRSPPAVVACVCGNVDALCARLTNAQKRAADEHPPAERELPIVFNEWATTWGNPAHERVVELAARLKSLDARYLVIDAGWYKSEPGVSWEFSHGDWEACAALFPKGLAATAAAIRAQGLVPGIWFECETCGRDSEMFQRTELLLQRDGMPVTVRGRRFLDFRKPETRDYLSQRMIALIEACGFGYLKLDYNETLGIGCDPEEDSPAFQGEGARQQTLALYDFLRGLRARFPELVIENCSSGGHRHEPSMLGLTAMSSFSDAHELREIPIIAANLQRLMLPRQCQVWAVLRTGDSERRLIYSLAACFLGRMCLSGEIDRLSEAQMEVVRRATGLYRQAAPIIRDGVSRRFGEGGESWRHPHGWQGVMRVAGDRALLVVHAFAEPPERIEVPVEGWRVVEQMGPGVGKEMRLAEFSGVVALLERE
jgi:alpha-galactosidase